MMTVLILLVVLAVVAVIANIVSDGGKKEDAPVVATDERDKSTEYFGSLNDRNVAALNYERMYRSLKKNSNDFKDLPDGVMDSFDHVATHLATIGNNADPQEVRKMVKNPLMLWGVEDKNHIHHELKQEEYNIKDNP